MSNAQASPIILNSRIEFTGLKGIFWDTLYCNKLKSLKVAKSKADVGCDGSLGGGGVSDGGLTVCVCDVVVRWNDRFYAAWGF